MLSKTGFTHSDLLRWQIDYAGYLQKHRVQAWNITIAGRIYLGHQMHYRLKRYQHRKIITPLCVVTRILNVLSQKVKADASVVMYRNGRD
ncbi:hypothetical protein GO191_24710 [Escherichia coli]|nr:hypothetical protein [Escherichia coli]